MRRFFAQSAPQAMRRSWVFIALGGFLCMGLGVLAGYLLFLEDPAWYHVFMPPELAGGRGPGGATTEKLRSVIFDETPPHSSGLGGAFATYLFSHNTRIAIFVFGLGVFACAPPAATLTFYNGLMLGGAFYALHVDRGLGVELGGWLSIHGGVTEISAICIAAGGGGLQLGGTAALFPPGDRTRGEALRHAGRDAVKLALVAALMLVAAALLEGFGRQLVQDTTTRYAIGWTIGLGWLTWFTLCGRARG